MTPMDQTRCLCLVCEQVTPFRVSILSLDQTLTALTILSLDQTLTALTSGLAPPKVDGNELNGVVWLWLYKRSGYFHSIYQHVSSVI